MKRVIKNYATLSPELRQLLTTAFPDGITAKDVVSFKDVKGNRLHGVELVTDDTLYLIRVEGILERIPADEGDDWGEEPEENEEEWSDNESGSNGNNNESFDEDRHYYE